MKILGIVAILFVLFSLAKPELEGFISEWNENPSARVDKSPFRPRQVAAHGRLNEQAVSDDEQSFISACAAELKIYCPWTTSPHQAKQCLSLVKNDIEGRCYDQL